MYQMVNLPSNVVFSRKELSQIKAVEIPEISINSF